FADAALSIASHEKAIGASVTFLPEWFREITVAYAIASFVGALMLGLVFFDLIGMTHLGPWDDLAPTPRRWLTRTALALAAWFLRAAAWLVAEALVYAIRLIAKIADALELVLHRFIDAVMYPGRVLWNWIASFDRARAIHLQPIRSVEGRALRLAPGDEPPALEEAAR